MDLSIIVCTYNRASTLARCLAHLATQQVPRGISWEIIVVDNNSTDGTSQVIREAAGNGFPVRCVREEKQGLCHARNRGIFESRGKIIAYIDDDILTDSAWLEGILSAFSETGCDAAGGRIHLKTEGRPLPKWVSPNLWGYLGYIDYGEERVVLDGQRRHPHGGNMAFRREVFEHVGLFNVSIGRVGNKLFKGSETEFFRRLVSANAKIIYEPGARVCHLIKAKELTKRHFRILQLRDGEQRAQNEAVIYPRAIMGVPLFIVSEFGRVLKGYGNALFAGSGKRFRREMDLWNLAGYTWGRYQTYRQGGR